MKTILSVITFLSLSTTLGCQSVSPEIKIKQYAGDGNIQTFEAWGKGVRIDFAPLSLSEPFTKTYRMENIPVIFQEYNLYLVVNSSEMIRWPRPEATISIELSNKAGDIYFKTNTKFSDWTWTNGHGGNAFYLLQRNVPEHSLSPSPDSEYFLNISYTPDREHFIPNTAFFRFTAGGLK